MEHHKESCQSPLGNMSQMQMFAFGIVAGVLVLCTLGFFILLGIMLKGGNINVGGDTAKLTDNTGNPIVQPPANAPVPVKGNVPPVSADDHVTGGKNAAVTLVEYSDFE